MYIQFKSDAQLYKAAEELYEIYGGKKPLYKRIRTVSRRRALLKNNIMDNILKGMELVKDRTYILFPDLLPQDEKLTIKKEQNQKWQAFCWYLGNFNSRVEINIDANFSWSQILPFCAHEAYPGHHTETVIKEKLLFREQNYFEHCIFMIQTPQRVIKEEIAEIAIDVLFSLQDQLEVGLQL